MNYCSDILTELYRPKLQELVDDLLLRFQSSNLYFDLFQGHLAIRKQCFWILSNRRMVVRKLRNSVESSSNLKLWTDETACSLQRKSHFCIKKSSLLSIWKAHHFSSKVLQDFILQVSSKIFFSDRQSSKAETMSSFNAKVFEKDEILIWQEMQWELSRFFRKRCYKDKCTGWFCHVSSSYSDPDL